jgi:hypothetical protein
MARDAGEKARAGCWICANARELRYAARVADLFLWPERHTVHRDSTSSGRSTLKSVAVSASFLVAALSGATPRFVV